MTFPRKFIKSPYGGLISAVVVAVGGFLLHHFPLGSGLIHWSYDLPFVVRPAMHPGEAVLVYMDDESHDKLEQPFNAPWDRRLHARLIERLTRAGARAVVMDIVFSDPAPEPDQRLAAAMQRSGRVILAADTVTAGHGERQVAMRMVTMPTDALRDQTAQLGLGEVEGVGTAELLPSQDFVVRRHFHGTHEDFLPSLSWVAARFLGANITRGPEERFRERWVHYYGPPGTITNVSYFRALDPVLSPDALFRGKVVYVGARLLTMFSGQRKDEFRTPWSYWMERHKFMAGAEVQATLLLNLLRGEWLLRWSATTERGLIVLAGLLAGFGLVQLRPGLATVAAVLAVAGVSAGAYALFRHQGVWVPWLVVVTQIGLALLLAIFINSVKLYVEKRLLEQTLSLHLSASRVKQLRGHPELLKPGAEKQPISILFSDIANFTTISERMDSDALAQLMNRYFEAAISRIHDNEGMVVKLIGDAIFAVWNAPLPQDRHEERACRAALMLRDQVSQFVDRRTGTPLTTRVGLHTGVANVGNFGSSTRFDYTAIGESVNLASRMEGLNKFLGTRVLITGDTQQAIAGQLDTRGLGRFRLKGLDKAVDVFELVGLLREVDPQLSWRETFAAGLEHFQKRRFAQARDCLERALRLQPDDGPSLFYIATLADLVEELLPDEWSGEVVLSEK